MIEIHTHWLLSVIPQKFPQSELNLTRDAKKNTKGFYRYLNQKRKVQEGILSLVSDMVKVKKAL